MGTGLSLHQLVLPEGRWPARDTTVPSLDSAPSTNTGTLLNDGTSAACRGGVPQNSSIYRCHGRAGKAKVQRMPSEADARTGMRRWSPELGTGSQFSSGAGWEPPDAVARWHCRAPVPSNSPTTPAATQVASSTDHPAVLLTGAPPSCESTHLVWTTRTTRSPGRHRPGA